MGNIVLLDDLTINQIAAGEVIERPANVVKELVENSIDAGATKISVEIENGGITSIRITDDGKGIAPDDVALAFERHATSKIRSAEDLTKVMTMGFRGEALASIAAIAKVELITRTRDQEIGTKVIVEGGDIISKEECGAPYGTTIIVRELFYNTPVRYKFLKKDFTEGGYIESAVEKIALINPSISFRLVNNRKTILQTSGNGDITTVVYNIFGKDVSQNLVDVDNEYEGVKVRGVAGKPEIARSNRTNQLFYVNGRNIKDKILSAAVEEAYRTLIPHGKFGFCIIDIRLNPELVDVNVHPAKLEVRFADESKVFKAVHYGIKNALLGEDITRDEEKEKVEAPKIIEKNVEETAPQRRGLFDIFRNKSTEQTPENPDEKYATIEVKVNKDNQAKNSVIDKIEFDEERQYLKPIAEETQLEELEEPLQNITYLPKEESNEVEEQEFEKIVEKNYKPEEDNIEYKVEEDIRPIYDQDIEEKSPVPEYKILGVAFNTYIILELDEDIYILDQHAAHERVLYEKVKENFYRAGGKEAQMLLLPDVLELSKRDMHIVKDHMDLFEQAGFTLEEFGENTIKITGVPVICFEMNTKDLFMDILDGIDITNRTNKQDIEEKFIATVACKAAVKANMVLDEREIRGLLDELLLLDNPFTCPHGRPTAIRITKTEIEKKFGRR